MLIIVDRRIPQEAKDKLTRFGELMELRTDNITYPALSGHPDIFFCQGPDRLIVAPNLPQEIVERLTRDTIPFITGEFPVGPKYPKSSTYNAVVTDKYLIHNFRNTDFIITRTFEDQLPVHVDQGYCRCNLLPLKNDHFITSDEGIVKVLKRHTGHILKVTTEGILLEGYKHGFFGGCCGVLRDKVFVTGALEYYEDGEKVEDFLKTLGYEIVELYDGPLFDGGGIFFVSV
jgi:hypothetical protein